MLTFFEIIFSIIFPEYFSFEIFFFRFFIPNPNSTQIDFKIGLKPFRFLHDDFQVLFSPFLRTLDSKLQMESAALETNR